MEGLLASTTLVLLLHGMTYVDARAVGCGGKPADVVFMLDASNSIWGPDFRKQLHFVKDVVDWFTIGRNEMRVSVITYADYPQLQFHLHYYFTKDQLWTAVDNIRQNGGYHTVTADALRYARQNVLGGRGDHIRENVTKVIVVITDGLSDNRTATALESARTKDSGIHVFAVGVGKDVDLEELDAIASQPSMYYTFLVDGYEGLSNIRELLAIKTCTVTDPPTTTTTTTTTTYQPTTETSTTTPVSTTSRDASYSVESTPGRAAKVPGDPEDMESETLRTPVILQPPNFLPIHTAKPLAELKAPDQTNCSQSTESQDNSTKDGESDSENQESPERPCVSKRGDGPHPDQTGRPEGGNGTDPNQTGRPGQSRSDSGDGPSKGMWLYDERGYMIASRFIKLKNKTTDVNESDTQALTEAQLPTVDTNVVPEEGLKNITLEIRRIYPDLPQVELYFGENLFGRGGYWYLDERLGFVWYRYISPGVFELDLETTDKIRGLNGDALESANREKVVTAPELLSRDPTSPPELSEPSERYSSENRDPETDRTSNDTASFQSTTQVPSGYWGYDEHGQLVWHRYIKAGVYQIIYPVTKTDAENAVTMRSGGQASTDTVAGVGPPSTARSQLATEGHLGSNEGGGDAELTLDGVELDFWKFIKGKSVSVQYVPPNDFDENDEESRLEGRSGFPGAVDMPPIQTVGSATGTGKDFRYSEETRRVWHSSRDLKGGSLINEEILLSTKEADANETMSVRLDNDKGRELWQQLVNLTGGKLDQSKFPSEIKNRFGVIKDKLPEKQEGSNNSDKPSDHLHESYWFTDETGRRFQVIHRYNTSDNDEARKPLNGNDGLDPTENNHFPEGRKDNDENVRWRQVENEEHGLHVPDAEGAVEYEKYGSEYWIRVVSSSKDGAASKPNKSPSVVLQPRSAPATPPLRHITTRPLPPQELRGNVEREGDETQKKGNLSGKQGKGKGGQKPERKNTKQKGLPVSGEKKERKGKPLVKGCRSRKPMDVIIMIDRRATQTSYADYMVNISQLVAAKLNNTRAVGGAVQVKFYPEIRNTLEPGHVAKAEDGTQTDEPPAVTLAGLSNILRKNAAENKRSGRKRSRPIIVYITDGRPAVREAKELKRKTPPAKIGKDVELYVVGVGEETNRDDLEAIARLSPSKSKTHVFHRLNPHSNISNLNDISVDVLSAVCRS